MVKRDNGLWEDASGGTVHILREIVLRLCVDRETSADPKNWSKDDSARGQCAVVALLVQDIFGGELLRGSLENVSGYEDMRSHYWNILSDGLEIDLTAVQFKDGKRNSVPNGEVRSREYLLSNFDTRKRYEVLKTNFNTVCKVLSLLKSYEKGRRLF